LFDDVDDHDHDHVDEKPNSADPALRIAAAIFPAFR